ncbi:MAG: hypothetical protein N2045_14185 [Fimbriimonadales bacterium]|nr:hypothetical protein [Fimbriimonadales bacterium]
MCNVITEQGGEWYHYEGDELEIPLYQFPPYKIYCMGAAETKVNFRATKAVVFETAYARDGYITTHRGYAHSVTWMKFPEFILSVRISNPVPRTPTPPPTPSPTPTPTPTPTPPPLPYTLLARVVDSHAPIEPAALRILRAGPAELTYTLAEAPGGVDYTREITSSTGYIARAAGNYFVPAWWSSYYVEYNGTPRRVAVTFDGCSGYRYVVVCNEVNACASATDDVTIDNVTHARASCARESGFSSGAVQLTLLDLVPTPTPTPGATPNPGATPSPTPTQRGGTEYNCDVMPPYEPISIPKPQEETCHQVWTQIVLPGGRTLPGFQLCVRWVDLSRVAVWGAVFDLNPFVLAVAVVAFAKLVGLL